MKTEREWAMKSGALLFGMMFPAVALAQDEAPVCQLDNLGRQWCLASTMPKAQSAFLGYSVHGIVACVIGVIVLIVAANMVWGLAVGPRWTVWQKHQSGLADLAQAKNEQQIQIAKAQSRLDAAELNKQAAIVEAEAVAEQVAKIGKELTSHDLYLKWQWIKMMEDNGSMAKVIYVPTEANIPILEAGKR